MKKHIILLSALAVASLFGRHTVQAQIAIKGDLIYTMTGAPIKNGVILIKDGKIDAVGAATAVQVPQSYKVYSAKVVTPGLVDAHTSVGLAGIYNVSSDQQELERTSPIQPELRALDSYNPNEELISWVRNYGTTTINTGHAPGALVSGQTMIVKTSPDGFKSILDTTSMVVFTVGSSVGDNFSSPKTSAKGIAMLRSELQAAQAYTKKMANADASKRPERNLKMETLAAVLKGEHRALITANKANDILTALRLKKEFNLDMVLDGAAESYMVIEEIKAAGVPVVLHPTMSRANGESKNISFETASVLAKAGIPVAIQSGFEQYVPRARVILFEASVAVANGMTTEQALAAVTTTPAKILGQEKRVGALAKGMDADVVLYDGDPFEYLTHVCTVIIDGKVVSDKCM
jgi:imidazolonepropionase-like amidohydrolase